MMLALPYLMKNLDPDTLEDLKEKQGRIKGALHTEDLKTELSPGIATRDEHNSPVPSSNKSGGGGPKPRTTKKAKR